jgi:hypothetical protein
MPLVFLFSCNKTSYLENMLAPYRIMPRLSINLAIGLVFIHQYIYTTFQLKLKGMNTLSYKYSIINVYFNFQQVVATVS